MIKDLKNLKKFLQLCRQQGVQSIRCGDIEVHLGEMPQQTRISRQVLPEQIMQSAAYAPGGITADTKILTDELTPEQLLFYSAVGHDQSSQEPS
jgi:hypothetical protein